MFEYKCKLVKVVDGDTVDIDIDLGFGVWLQKQRMQEWLDGGNLKIVTHKDAKGKYGRILGDLYTFDTNVNDKMVEECHAVGYHGQSKEEIAEEHLLNRKNVVI